MQLPGKGLKLIEKYMEDELIVLLNQRQHEFHFVCDMPLEEAYIFDFTIQNRELASLNLNNEKEFCEYINNTLSLHKTAVGIGRYNEDRVIYKRSEVFRGVESRSLHLGIDIWAAAGTVIYAPVAGTVHSFADNEQHGDYGPTIILEHRITNKLFYTLYGHLSKDSLKGIRVGDRITAGSQIARLGEYHENVHWPPHLHFQVIKDMEGKYGDYPGVAKPSEAARYLRNCPDPNLILGIARLR